MPNKQFQRSVNSRLRRLLPPAELRRSASRKGCRPGLVFFSRVDLMRRLLLLAIALSLFNRASDVWPQSQQQAKTWIVGTLMVAAERDDPIVAGLRQGLRELGYVEGKNLKLEFRTAQGQAERLQRLAEELVQVKADVIVVMAPQAARAVLRATPTIPIVAATFDPVAMGMASNLARPGGQLTGLSSASVDLYAKRLQLLREMIPRISRVAVLSNPAAPPTPFQTTIFEALKAAAASMSITLNFVATRGPEDFEAAFAAINQWQAQALLLVEHPLYYVHRAELAKHALKFRLPALYATAAFPHEGGLMSYGVDYSDQTRRMAAYIDRIFKGARPGDLPIEQPRKFELVINLKTAKALGVTIPESILAQADRVIR
jgi:putative ABC transport system substrate-binding protein